MTLAWVRRPIWEARSAAWKASPITYTPAVEVQHDVAGFDAVDGDLGGWDAAQYGRGHGHLSGQRLRRGKLPEQSPLLADVAVEREG